MQLKMAVSKRQLALWTLYLLNVCFVMFFTGTHGNVPDDTVYTELHKDVRIGDSAVLTCRFRGSPLAVYWKKGDDPRHAPNLVSWIPSDNVTGKCEGKRPCEIMEMNENRSLVIKEVGIAEQGRYICRVSNYKGYLIHNFTDIKLFLPPNEPYPAIDRCFNGGSSDENFEFCRVLTNTTIIVTCSVTNYYPQIDLFFLHGHKRMAIINSVEKTNDDSTKNKSISIEARVSKIPYTCVASSIPGSKERRAATILTESLTYVESSTLISSTPIAATMETLKGKNTGNQAAKIAILLVVLLSSAVAFRWCIKYHRRNTRYGCIQHVQGGVTFYNRSTIDGNERITLLEKQTLGGDLSYFELWTFAYDTSKSDRMKVHETLIKLGFEDVKEGMSAQDVYNLLCMWKDGNKSCNHSQLLQSALKDTGYETKWEHLCEKRQSTGQNVTRATLYQLIRDIDNPNTIQKFLCRLIPKEKDCIYEKVKGNDAMEEATKLLRKWRDGPFEENPNALLSLALDVSHARDMSKDFFAGVLSFPELWKLSSELAENGDKSLAVMKELRMHMYDLPDRMTKEDIYVAFCDWKEAISRVHQGKLLRDALETAEADEIWRTVEDFRMEVSYKVPLKILEHILWQIKDPKKINEFLQKLTNDVPSLDDSKDMASIIQDTMLRLEEWQSSPFDENPVSLLSHALEKTGCKPVDRSFFKVPSELVADITKVEVEAFVSRLTRGHIMSLMPHSNIDKTEYLMDTIVASNKNNIFDSNAMLTDWIKEEECSNYEKRLKLKSAAVQIGRQELKDFFGKEMIPEIHLGVKNRTSGDHTKEGTMERADFQQSDFNESEFKRIALYLPDSDVKSLFNCKAESGNAIDGIRDYVENWMARHPKGDVRKKLREKLKPHGLEHLVPLEVEEDVYDIELVDIAFRLVMTDVYPLAKALGISEDKLGSYKRLDTSNLLRSWGTQEVLIKICERLSKKFSRTGLCDVLDRAGSQGIALLLQYGYELSFGDLCKVAYGSGGGKEQDARIRDNLGITRISVRKASIMDILKHWRSLVKRPTYNPRTALADAVFPVQGKEKALDIISGKVRTTWIQTRQINMIKYIREGVVRDQKICFANILDEQHNISETEKFTIDRARTMWEKSLTLLKNMSPSKQSDLCIRLKVGGFPTTSSKLGKHWGKKDRKNIDKWINSDILSRLKESLQVPSITKLSSTEEVLVSWIEKVRKTPLDKQHCIALSNRLLKEGFKTFSFEVMIGSFSEQI